jgi:hypothetical protein
VHRAGRWIALAGILLVGAALPAVAQSPEPGGVAVLPLRSRGLSVAEHRRIAGRVASSFKQARADVLGPEELGARLARDERRRSAIEEARRLVADGAEKSLNMESSAAIASYDRALALWRDNFGEWVDAPAMADAFVRRAAEKMDTDPSGARADLFAAVTIAPDRTPSIDDFPPKVVEAFDAARGERARDSFGADDPKQLAALGAALGTTSVAITRAERGDRIEEGVGVEVAVFAVRLSDRPRTARAVLPGLGESGIERVDAMVDQVSGRGPVAVGTRDIGRPDPIRTPPPIRRPTRDRPLWKNPWIWAGAGAIAVAGGGYGVYTLRQEEEEGPGFKVILAPAPPDE